MDTNRIIELCTEALAALAQPCKECNGSGRGRLASWWTPCGADTVLADGEEYEECGICGGVGRDYGVLAGYSKLLTLATGWLLADEARETAQRWFDEPENYEMLVTATRWLTQHDAAEQIIATIAAKLAPCYAPLADAMGEGQ